jgi:hypothetical protein
MTMELGLAIGYSGAQLDVPVARVQRAKELGYDSVWSAERRGFGDAAKRIQKLCLAGQMAEAIATVPDEWVDLKSLGPPARIPERYRAWEDNGADLLKRAIARAQGHRGDGRGRAAELKCERADGPRARDAGTLNRFRERATLKALPANILTS